MRETHTIKGRLRTSLYVWAFVLTPWTVTALPGGSHVEVVVNDNVEQQILSVTTIRAIFGMRLRSWPDGRPIRVFVLYDERPLHAAFCKQILNIFPHQLRLAWDRLVFSGTGQAPYRVGSEEEMRSRVASTSGAIGYLGRTMINESVRVPVLKQ